MVSHAVLDRSGATGDANPRLRSAVRAFLDHPGANRLITGSVRALTVRSPRLAAQAELRLRRTGLSRIVIEDESTLLMDAGRHSDWLTNRLYWRGAAAYEPEVLGVLLALSRRAQVVLDIGAHVGLFTLLVAHKNPRVSVISFEPVNDVFERLAVNVALNRLSKVICVRAAVGAVRGQLPLYSSLGQIDTVASTSVEHRATWAPGPWRCDFTDVISLDDFADQAKLTRVDLVKIDVEQQEHEVIQGMQRLLTDHRPHVVCEVLPHGKDSSEHAQIIDTLLRPHGYHIYLLQPEGPVLRRHVTGDFDHWNQLFTILDPPSLASALAETKLRVVS